MYTSSPAVVSPSFSHPLDRRERRERRLSRLTMAVAAACGLALTYGAPQAEAATITWGAPTTVSGDADVSTTGALFEAYNLGAVGVTATTVNGVTFSPFAQTNTASVTVGNFTIAAGDSGLASLNTFGSAAAPFNNLTASYKTLLSSAVANGNLPSSFTLTMNGLTVDDSYQFQWWSSASDQAYVLTTTATAGAAANLSLNTTSVVGGVGQFATGAFTADATSQVITFNSTLQPVVNAFQLRNLTPTAAFWTGDQGTSWATNNAGNTNWATAQAGTVDTGATPGSLTDVTFSATNVVGGTQNTTLDRNFTIKSLTVNDPAAVTIASGVGGPFTLTIAGAAGTGITVANAANLTISSNVTLSGGANTIAVNGTGVALISGTLSGTIAGGLIKSGTGTLTLTGTNNYTGGTTINGGTLAINNGAALSTGNVTVGNTATLLGTANLTLTNQLLFAAAAPSTVAAATGTTLTLTSVDMSAGAVGTNAVFGSAGHTGVVTIGPAPSAGAAPASTIRVAFGTLRNGGGATNLSFFTSFVSATTVDAGATLDMNDFNTTVKNLQGAGAVTLGNRVDRALTVQSGNFSGGISGAGQLAKTTAGTLTLTGTNNYTGGTTINGGTLAINNGAALGTGNVTVGNTATLLGTANLTLTNKVVFATAATSTVAAATGTTLTLGALDIAPTANAVFGSAGNTGVVVVGPQTGVYSVNADGTIKVAFGTLRNGGGASGGLNFFTSFVSSTTVDAGATLDANGFGTAVKNLLGAGTLTNDGAAPATFTIQAGTFSGVIQDGTGVTSLTKDTAGTLTFTGAANNTCTGPTNINDGILLLDNITALNAGIRSAVINVGDGVGAAGSAILRNATIGGNINDASALTINSDGLFDLNNLGERIGSLAGTAGSQVTLGATGTLITGGNNTSTTYAGTITGGGGVTKEGTGTWTLTGASAAFTGTTNINAGRLWAQNASALGGAAGGATTISTGGILRTTGLLNLSTLNWGAGNLHLAPGAGTGDVFTINTAGGFQNVGGAGGAYIFDPTGLAPGTTYTLTNYTGATNFTVNQFSAAGPGGNVTYQGTFTLNPTNVQFLLAGATATGNVLQNSAPVGIPTFANFIITGPVTTGGPGENNAVGSLTFLPGGALTILNTLTVGNGNVNLPSGTQIILGQPSGPTGNLVSNLNIAEGGILSGVGTIFGHLVNAGLVSPGYSPGKMAVTGNYTQTSTGTLRIEIAGRKSGQFDLLAVGGTASLDGTLDLVRLNGFKPRRGDKIKFLTAGGGVNGEFAHVNNGLETNTILSPVVVYHDHSVALEVEGSYVKFAEDRRLSRNQRAVARTLDSVARDNARDKAIVYLDQRWLGHLPADFDKVAPTELGAVSNIGTATAQVQGINLQGRTAGVRSGASGFSANGLAMQGTGPGYSGSLFGAAGPSGKESKEVKETMTPEEEKRWGAFLTGVGEWVDVDGDGNARGFDVTTGGFTLGVDYKVTPNFVLGLAAGYAGTGADLTDNGRMWVNGGKLGLYATYFTGGFYVDAAVSGGYNSYDTKRSALQGAARGSTDGGELDVLFGTGYDWKMGAFSIGPTATFQYTLVGMDGFTERGSLAPLNIASQDSESIRSALGFKASYDWKLGGVIVRPEIRAAWQHEFGDQSSTVEASFASGAGSGFLVNGPQIGRDSLLIGAGFAIQCSERFSTYFYYDGELGRERFERHSVSGGVRVAF